MKFTGEIPSEQGIKLLRNQPEEGEVLYCKKENKFVIFQNNKWEDYKQDSHIGINLYDLNKNFMDAQNPLTKDQIEAYRYDFHPLWENNEYLMLLCKDYNYYTVFHKTKLDIQFGSFFDNLIECCEAVGDIIDIDSIKNEIWIRIDDENFLFVLFPYNEGVVEFNG